MIAPIRPVAFIPSWWAIIAVNASACMWCWLLLRLSALPMFNACFHVRNWISTAQRAR